MLERHTDLATISAADIMGKSPKVIDKNELAANALHIMRENNITQLLVSDQGNYDGVIHIQDLLKEGII
ncbi:D-arabinose 5-phosphate isomerase [compost metagenome]